MKATWKRSWSFLLLLLVFVPRDSIAQTRFVDAHDKPPQGWQGRIFHLSQDYPLIRPVVGSMPWSSIDFTKYPQEYLQAVLKYAYEDNIVDGDWQPEKNIHR